MLLQLVHVLPHAEPACQHRRLCAPQAAKAPKRHQGGADPPEIALQKGATGKQRLQQVDRLSWHAHPLPQRQHLSGMAMAWPSWERLVAVGLNI